MMLFTNWYERYTKMHCSQRVSKDTYKKVCMMLNDGRNSVHPQNFIHSLYSNYSVMMLENTDETWDIIAEKEEHITAFLLRTL